MIAAAIVLAAGRGSRMGGPKALLRLDGEWLVAAHARRLSEVSRRVLVVVPSAIAAQVTKMVDVPVLAADTPSQAHSLAAALQALEATAPLSGDDRVLITPVDARPAAADTLRALMAVEADAACPTYGGRHGHPLIVRRRVLDPYFTDPDPPRLDKLVTHLRVLVACEDPATVEDFDRPEDVPRP